jgi:ribosomal protein S25
MSEIQDAVQIIRVAYDGVEIAMKVGSGTIESMKKAIDLLIGMLDYENSMGKTSMRKLLQKGGDLQVFQFQSEDMKKVERMAKKYGILYSVLPDVNKADKLSEIIFHTEAVPRISMMMQKLKFGRIANFDDYLKNGDEKDLDKLLSFLRTQQKGNEKLHTEEAVRANILMEGLIEKVGLFAMEKKSISVEAVKENFRIDEGQAENILMQLGKIGVLDQGDSNGNYLVLMDQEAFQNRIRGYQELADRMRAVSASKDMNLVDVTITKQLILEENDHSIKTKIPGGKGKSIWLEKSNIMEIHDGKTLLTFLDKNKEYKLYSEDNRVVGTMKGDKLYEGHYDRVGNAIRERYEKAQVQRIVNTATISRAR